MLLSLDLFDWLEKEICLRVFLFLIVQCRYFLIEVIKDLFAPFVEILPCFPIWHEGCIKLFLYLLLNLLVGTPSIILHYKQFDSFLQHICDFPD